MSSFYILNAKKLKQYLLIITVSLFTALLLLTQNSINIPVFSSEGSPKAVYKGEDGIALTFDIGWGDEKAETIINTLDRHKTKATFFLSGSWAERHPDLVKKIQKNNYEIGLLGYNYQDYTSLSEAELQKDIRKAQEVFTKLQVENIQLIRTPTGHFNQAVLKTAEKMGLTLVHWSVNTHDWKNPGSEKILTEIKKSKPGDIILMHASDSARQTNQVLPSVIDHLSRTSKLVTVSELIENGQVETKLVP
ncbi:polysaccharide deacetylase family sporulation protein PdaB [Bacillus ectoiniformans]|uniref:polysaccharide deacetylase family sporulation protein PdaB n=1 Tax=Bacillus ectoiniformans TaxID=1494429 RepID=UPI0019569FA0|nr:polysaccharide deacetylase family sporulation protein PdaB [Bacillus ectoiniformans]MBM7650555.1 polysaccharide deacetylase family sporulation protein PdaB [Bacillus ectoiniformans]